MKGMTLPMDYLKSPGPVPISGSSFPSTPPLSGGIGRVTGLRRRRHRGLNIDGAMTTLFSFARKRHD